ncbi:MAG: DUF5615 family PIN-like protein [Planctomycetia bacterium]|nr:DUF5615 family PIN-like protein [Planctomycetia bacterium]
MKIVADESVDRPIVEHARAMGHEIIYISEVSPGVSDDVVLEKAVTEKSPLMTSDKDFGELVYRLRRVHFGIILLRLSGLSAALKSACVTESLRLTHLEWTKSFVTISPGGTRVRLIQ